MAYVHELVVMSRLGQSLVERWPAKEKAPREGDPRIPWDKQVGVGAGIWTDARDMRDMILRLSRGDIDMDCMRDFRRGSRMGGARDYDSEGYRYFGP